MTKGYCAKQDDETHARRNPLRVLTPLWDRVLLEFGCKFSHFYLHSSASNCTTNQTLQNNPGVSFGMQAVWWPPKQLKQLPSTRNSSPYQQSTGSNFNETDRLHDWSAAVLRGGRWENQGASPRKTLSWWPNEGKEHKEQKQWGIQFVPRNCRSHVRSLVRKHHSFWTESHLAWNVFGFTKTSSS